MGISWKRLFRSRESPEGEKPEVEKVTSVELLDPNVYEAFRGVYILELAFWTCVSKIANALSKCEFRTYVKGEEVFGAEYYLWNYSPNKNQNKAEFLSKAMEKLYRNNELLIVESYDGQLFVADSFTVTKNTLYGNTFRDVLVDDYQFTRVFQAQDVLYWKLNNKNVTQIIRNMYASYSKLIEYACSSFLKSRGSRGILDISAIAQANKKFDENLKKILNEYFKSFFSSSNAVLPLFEGYKDTDLGSKTYNETSSRDIKSQYDDIFDFMARGLSMPPSLAKGDVQDTSKAVDEMLTFCLDPLADMLQQEINRKRNGEKLIQNGTCLRINTTKVKHIDIFDIAVSVEKLISSGICTVNMLLRAIGEQRIDEEWADKHFMTKNYADIDEILKKIQEKGGE